MSNDKSQIRRNKRSLEQFYDAKYIDTCDGSLSSGIKLSSGRRIRDRNKSGENLRQYCAQKVKSRQIRIKRRRHLYQPYDLAPFDEGDVIRMQNLGTGVKLKDYPAIKNKIVGVKNVQPI